MQRGNTADLLGDYEMFEAIAAAPADPILGLNEAFAQDDRQNKVNLSVGVYKDEQSRTPILATVKEAERRLLDAETSKSYLPISGSPVYARVVQNLLLGSDHPLQGTGRLATAHTPGGTGALRVAADYLAENHEGVTVWLSDPTWANHQGIFQAAGLAMRTYPYFDAANNALDFDGMCKAIDQMKKGDAILLHGCCHNPTGVDPTDEQWAQLASLLKTKGVLPLVDFAYQGFADGLEQDASGLKALLGAVDELIVCSSYSKNFGLYNERVGAMTVVAATDKAASAVLSHVKRTVRTNFSNPPSHGGAIVSCILDDAELARRWEAEVAAMRERIHDIREAFASGLEARNVQLSEQGNDFIRKQRGMFSFSGLNKAQVQKLRDDLAIYIVGSGRINVAGLTPSNLDRVCDAIAKVV